jgi:hypothetical protein
MPRALRIRIALAIGTLSALVGSQDAHGREQNEEGELGATEEPNFVLEIGPAAEWPLHGGANYGGTVAVEKEVNEAWLELEAGFTGLGTSGRGELSGDLLFKKPFRLVAPESEFFIGVGPEIAHTFNGSDRGTLARIEFATELMFLPRTGVGWYLEPAFSVAPATGEKSFGFSAGLAVRF